MVCEYFFNENGSYNFSDFWEKTPLSFSEDHFTNTFTGSSFMFLAVADNSVNVIASTKRK